MIGKTIGHYRIVDKLGEGGMGEVWLAEDTRLGRRTALKFLPSALAGGEEAQERFIREARAASALDHPNICTIYEAEETDEGQTYIAMAYCEGETIKKKIARGPLRLEEALDIAIQMGEGLARAHREGIVHRDIKPANAIITGDGTVKIVDFGLAKFVGATRLTTTGTSMGTAAYMSPEQVRGEGVDHRTDVWALGVVLYEMVTGRPPFESDHEQGVVYAILQEEPEPITALRARVPMELERVVGKTLNKNPEARYQHMEDLLVDLNAVRTLLETGPVPSTGKRKVPRFLPGKRALALSGAVAVVVAGAATVYLLTRNPVPSGIPRVAVLPFENLGAADEEYFADGITDEIISRLSRLRGLKTLARSSVMQYKATEKPIGQIAEELSVDYILEGTVRWQQLEEGGSLVRITPRLIQTSDETEIWSFPYTQGFAQIFQIQADVAEQVALQLDVKLLEQERRAMQTRPTENLDAYQAYLRGRFYASRPHFTPENWNQALENYQRAVELDPGFALAWARLSEAHSRFYFLRRDLSEKRRAMARDAAERAIALAPDDPQTRLALGYYHLWSNRDPERALEEFSRAAKSLPDNSEVLEARAAVFELQGDWEMALDTMEAAFELDPRSVSILTDLVAVYWVTRRYRLAADASDQAIALAPDQEWPYLYKVFNYWSWKGVAEETRATLDALPIEDDWTKWAWFWQEVFEGQYQAALERLSAAPGEWIRLKTWAAPKSLYSASVYEVLDRPRPARAAYESARELLEAEVEAQPDDPRYHSSLGIAYAGMGRKEEAIREGKRAVALLPVSRDAFYGLSYVQDLAIIYGMVGEKDAALDQIEYLLSVPSWFSIPWLQMDPRFDPLRDHPRYERLLNRRR